MAIGRYARINLDGLSITKTKLSGAITLLAGNVVKLSGQTFVKHSTDGKKQDCIYIVNVNESEGQQSADTIAAASTIVGEIAETGRQLAVLVKAAAVLVEDTPLTSAGDGTLRVAVLGTDEVIAYSQEALTVGASAQLVKVRFA